MKRDSDWISLAEEIRSTILRGILDSEIIPNELLGTPSPSEDNKEHEEPVVIEQVSDDENDVEQQQVVLIIYDYLHK